MGGAIPAPGVSSSRIVFEFPVVGFSLRPTHGYFSPGTPFFPPLIPYDVCNWNPSSCSTVGHPPTPLIFPPLVRIPDSKLSSPSLSPPPPPLHRFLCVCTIWVLRHIIFITSRSFYVIVMSTFFQALDIAHPQKDKWIFSPSHFSSFFTV